MDHSEFPPCKAGLPRRHDGKKKRRKRNVQEEWPKQRYFSTGGLEAI